MVSKSSETKPIGKKILTAFKFEPHFQNSSSVPKLVKFSNSMPWMTQHSCQGLSLRTRLGSMGTHLHNWRRQGRSSAQPRACSLFSSTFMELFTLNLSPRGQPVNSKFYYNLLRCQREDIQWKQPELWCKSNWMTTMHPLISASFLAVRAWWPSVSILLVTFGPLRLSLPKDEVGAEELLVWCCGDPVRIPVLDMHWKQDFLNAFHQWQQCWDGCSCTRGLFWRWCPNLNWVSTFFYISLVSELFDTTS